MKMKLRGVEREIEFSGVFDSKTFDWYFNDDLIPTEDDVTDDELIAIEQQCREVSFNRSCRIEW